MALKRHDFVRRRRAVGFTQESLAEAMGVERSTVARWETGKALPQPYMRPKLAAVLQLDLQDLGDHLASTADVEAVGTERTRYAMRHPSRVDLAAATQLRQGMQTLTDRYDLMPSASLLAQAGQHVSQVAFLAGEAPAGRVQREMRVLQADSTLFMGQLVWDASQRRDHATARSFYTQSFDVGRHLRSPTVEGHALLRTCYVALYGADDHREGLDLALETARTTRHTSHALTGLAMLHAAEAHAFLGEERECERALSGAEKHLAHADGTDTGYELLSPTHFGRMAGSCYLSLGDHRRAQQHLEDTATQMQERRKSRAIVLGNLVLSRIRAGELDAALATFAETVDELRGTRGGGGTNLIFRAARELRPWRSEPAVQDAQDRLMALMEAA